MIRAAAGILDNDGDWATTGAGVSRDNFTEDSRYQGSGAYASTLLTGSSSEGYETSRSIDTSFSESGGHGRTTQTTSNWLRDSAGWRTTDTQSSDTANASGTYAYSYAENNASAYAWSSGGSGDASGGGYESSGLNLAHSSLSDFSTQSFANTYSRNQSTTTAADGSQVLSGSASGSATATGSASHQYSSDWSTHAATTGPDYSSTNDGNGTNSIQAADTYNYQETWSE